MREDTDGKNFWVFRPAGPARLTQRQIHEYLLCDACEDKFNKNGEAWVIENCARQSGFPLASAVLATNALTISETSGTFRAHVPGVQVDKLVYFATSFLWRLSVGKWPLADRFFGPGTIDLGGYAEPLRLYLLGQQSFPESIVLSVDLDYQQKPTPAATLPGTGVHDDGAVQYSFSIPGIMFNFVLGAHETSNVRLLSIINNPAIDVITVSDFPGRFLRNLRIKT